MLSQMFMGIALLGAEWVLYLLLLISVLSVAVIIERAKFFKNNQRKMDLLSNEIRAAAQKGKWAEIQRLLDAQPKEEKATSYSYALAEALSHLAETPHAEALDQISNDAILRVRKSWEKNLTVLATIGSNAPFVGLFGTVLGIIQAFHDIAKTTATTGVQGVSSGLSEALIATAVGILVAIPAVVAYNFYNRRVKNALQEAEALKSFLIGKILGGK